MEANEPAATPSALWDKILTTTPVVLTVIATLLAGQSTSEMTRAQYHRSLAGQMQSKVADQWAFFQAKRTRKTVLEKAADGQAARVLDDQLDENALRKLTERLAADFRLAEDETERLVGMVDKLGPAGAAFATFKTVAQKALREARGGGEDARRTQASSAEKLHGLAGAGQPEVWHWLNSDDVPRIQERHSTDQAIGKARQAIADRRPDAELVPLVKAVQPEPLREALEAADANAAAFDGVTRPIDQTIHQLNDVAAESVRLAHRLARLTRDLKLALPVASLSGPAAEIGTATERLDRHAADVRVAADEVGGALRMAWDRFTARRYDRDAAYNQDAAFLYEIQVHQESAESDRHLNRSRNFLYGMLAAQMATTIATLALAVRMKSVLWGLASLAGIGAVLYGIYVYLDLVP